MIGKKSTGRDPGKIQNTNMQNNQILKVPSGGFGSDPSQERQGYAPTGKSSGPSAQRSPRGS